MKIRKVVFAGLFLMSSLTIASAQVKLSFNPEKGKKYEYQTDVIQNIQQSVMGQSIPMEMEMSVKYLMEISDKTPQETTVQYIFKEVAYIISSPMIKMGYDSNDSSEKDNILGKMFSNLIDVSLMAIIAPDGSVKSLTGMDAVVEKMNRAIASEGQTEAQIGASIMSQFSDDALKNSFQQLLKIYPANKVKAGESWNMESAISVNSMNTNIKTKYTLKEIGKNMASIAVSSDLDMNMGAGMDGEITGAGTGTMSVDVKTGLPLMSEINQNMKGTVKAQGMEIQMELITKTKTTIQEVK